MNTIELATKLIANQSITPNDANCQHLIADYLSYHGFQIEHLPYGNVSNLWATHGNGKPYIALAGHTDVVPPGDGSAWITPPFQPVIKDGYLYGRGAVDMKGGLASMLTACINFVKNNPKHKGTLGILLTSDEEGDAENGTKKVVTYLQQKNITLDYCLLAEPSSNLKVGDTIKIGRRGSMVGTIKIFGIQGHVAYPNKVKNPIHAILPILTSLQNKQWDQGNIYFPPTNLQITSILADSPATNVTPAELTCNIAIRFSPEITSTKIQTEIEHLLKQQSLKYEIDWRVGAEPFITTSGNLVKAVQQAIETTTGYTTNISTGGGTSDARFIATICPEIVELGPLNSYAHKVNECVSCDDLNTLSIMYEKILTILLLNI